MMVKGIVFQIVFILTSSSAVISQTLKKDKIYSEIIKDSISVHTILPKDWNDSKKFPVIYKYEFLSISDGKVLDLITKNVNFYSGYLQQIPQTIVVGIDLKNSEQLGFSYSGGINDNGTKFLKAVENDIFTFIEEKYSASPKFRIYFGHSQGGSYGNYLFLNKASLFHSYMILAPEQIDTDKPPFIIEENLIKYYKRKNCTSYYLASGDLDLQRRKDHAQHIIAEMNKVSAGSFHFSYDLMPEVGHINIIPHAIPHALEEIYKPVVSFDNNDSITDVLTYFQEKNEFLKKTFDLEIEKNTVNASFFRNLAVVNNDIDALRYFADYFLTASSDGIEFYNYGYLFNQLNAKDAAVKYLDRSIQVSRKNEAKQHSAQNAITIYMAYRTIALNVYQDNPLKAMGSLKKGLKETDDVRFKYFIGKMGVENNLDTEESVKTLLSYIELDHNDDLWSYISDEAYFLLGKGYTQLGMTEKAKENLEKAIKLNPENNKAKQLLDTYN